MSESAVSAKRGWGFVWREIGAVRNDRPSRGQAAAHPDEAEVGKKNGIAFRFRRTDSR